MTPPPDQTDSGERSFLKSLRAAELPPFLFKQCLLLCLPALMIGLILRVSFIAAIPEANYASDGGSWVSTCVQLWNKHKLRFDAKRRWLYEAVIAFAPLLPGSVPQVVAVAQHAMGLGAVIGVGWIAGNVTRYRRVAVPLATLIAATWPSMLYHEHDVSAESVLPALFIAAVATAFPLSRLGERRRLFWFLVLAGLMAITKPHGKPIWAGLMVFVFFHLGYRYRWKWEHITAVLITIVLMQTMGEKEQGGWLLLSSTLPLVKEQGAKWQEYRDVLRPGIEATRARLEDYPWFQKHWKKGLGSSEEGLATFGEKWIALRHSKDFTRAAKDLAREAILAHPFTYAGFILKKNEIAASGPAVLFEFHVPRFWRRQSETDADTWADNPKKMQLLYKMDKPQFYAMVAERVTRHFVFADWLDKISARFLWMKRVGPPSDSPVPIRPNWPLVLVAFGLVMALILGRGKAVAIMVLPAVLHNLAVFAIGDSLPRYLLPVEWVGWILIAIGFDAVLCLFALLLGKLGKSKALHEIPPDEAGTVPRPG